LLYRRVRKEENFSEKKKKKKKKTREGKESKDNKFVVDLKKR